MLPVVRHHSPRRELQLGFRGDKEMGEGALNLGEHFGVVIEEGRGTAAVRAHGGTGGRRAGCVLAKE